MLKKKIKLIAAMLSLVLIVGLIGNTSAKYTGNASFKMNMDVIVPYSARLHESSMLDVSELYNGITYSIETTDANGDPVTEKVTCRVLTDTNKVSINISGKDYLRITARKAVSGDEKGYCFDPYVILNFQSTFKAAGMDGYKYWYETKDYRSDDYYGLPTTSLKYAVIPYFIPEIDLSQYGSYSYTTGGKTYTNSYNSSACIDSVNHIRVYPCTTINKELGQSFGSSRYYASGKTTGQWQFAVVDLEEASLKTGSGANGTPNWEGNLYELRLDIGQIGALENWYTRFDCPSSDEAGKLVSIYIGDIRFCSSYYGAERIAKNLSTEARYSTTDPTTKTYADSNEIMVYYDSKEAVVLDRYKTMLYSEWKEKEMQE